MKKGESIRLEIRDVDNTGITLYSYKKKTEIFVDRTQLKAGFEKEKYQKQIGNPMVFRLVSTRPEIKVSEKFIHPEAPIFDDYALRPAQKQQNDLKDNEQDDNNSHHRISMINDKKIIITKENQFDKGWTIFHPYEFGIVRNPFYKDADVANIIKKITYCNSIDLILSEPCLPSRIVSEIQWANKYIKVNIVAKYENIIRQYSNLVFESKTIDENVGYNYIGITGKDPGYYIINGVENKFCEISSSLLDVYYSNNKQAIDTTCFKNANKIIIIDSNGQRINPQIINIAKSLNIECYYVINTKAFNRDLFDYAKQNNLQLIVSNGTVDSILLVGKDDSISRLIIFKGQYYLTTPIYRIHQYISYAYKCDFYNDNIDASLLNDDVYSCNNGVIQKLEIQDKKVIPITQQIASMDDFVNEVFDSSIVESHNDYSAVAKQVEYQFTLVPPILDKTYGNPAMSYIYANIRSLRNKWVQQQKLKYDKIKTDYSSFMESDFGIIDFLNKSITFTDYLIDRTTTCDYICFHNSIEDAAKMFRLFGEDLINICRDMFNSINDQSSNKKFDKFDAEIEGYQQTIQERTALIKQGIDVLENQHRIDRLTQKINGLLELKKKFESSSDTRNDKVSANFISHCKDLLANGRKDKNNESISNIVKPKEETKLAKLEAFVNSYLYELKQYVDSCLPILNSLLSEHIPEDYKVYEKDGKGYIAIEELNEFEKTKNICEEFGLKCIARR